MNKEQFAKIPKAVIIAGPTAAGKTEYAIETALALDTEIISADSMQIYQFMNIGSAKPSDEELAKVPHHLVGEISPEMEFSVFDYQKRARNIMAEMVGRGKIPVICGGTGLYINSIVYNMDFSKTSGDWSFREKLRQEAEEYGSGYVHEKLMALDPEAAERIHPNNVKKVIRAIEVVQDSGKAMRAFSESFQKNQAYDFCLIGLLRDRKELYERIDLRVDMLMEKGLLDEVKGLLAMGLKEENISMKGIGYKEIIGYLHGHYDLHEAVSLVKKNTRHYAKRQLTWFRRLEGMHWINLSTCGTKEEAVDAILKILQ